MTDNLFLAILSMDAYNRGYNAGIGGLDAATETKIGDASIVPATDSREDSLARAAGLYAVADDWNDQKVISYRGTDNPTGIDLSNDMLTGWLLGAGIEDGDTMISRYSERPKTPSKEIAGRAVRHCRLR